MGSNSISSGEGSYPSKYMLSISLIIRHNDYFIIPDINYLLSLRPSDLRRGESYHQDDFPESPITEDDNAKNSMAQTLLIDANLSLS